ncbi:MAG: DUF1566 domain-containing protein [Candidatus Contendobacter sp.]|nr:MAG: DUF1566 domain-containing protein [Candidatus Contendobacter sp.]
MPTVDGTNGAGTADVLSGKTFWGLTSGAWGAKTGTLPTQTLSDASTTVNTGYYVATTLNAVDSDLAAANIKSGISIFGVAGTYTGSGGTISAPFPVAKTGAGAIAGYTLDPNEDGVLQKGVAWPNPRFTDNGNGTVTDNLTSLVWLKNANCSGSKQWAAALTWTAALASPSCGLNDGSVAGQWRLPNIKEFSSLVSAEASFALPAGHPFMDVQYDKYWSSTTCAFDTDRAWQVDFHDGYVSWMTKTDTITLYVWPVRGGQ